VTEDESLQTTLCELLEVSPDHPNPPLAVAASVALLLHLKPSAALREVRDQLIGIIDALAAGPKSRERSIVITKLQEALLWAGEAERLEFAKRADAPPEESK
jgi:hypothetical protein